MGLADGSEALVIEQNRKTFQEQYGVVKQTRRQPLENKIENLIFFVLFCVKS